MSYINKKQYLFLFLNKYLSIKIKQFNNKNFSSKNDF